jgi:hypothetical protein
MKKYIWFLAVTLLFTACINEDNPALVKNNVVGSWISQYDEEGYTWLDDPYDHVVQYYRFFDDETGFYELYYFKDNAMIMMDYGRDWYEDFTYTMKNGQVTVTYELDEVSWTLNFAGGRLTDMEGHRFTPSTENQDEQVLAWFTSQHIAGDDDDDITTPVHEDYISEPGRAPAFGEE